jgi:hypothetical protein
MPPAKPESRSLGKLEEACLGRRVPARFTSFPKQRVEVGAAVTFLTPRMDSSGNREANG